MMGGVAGFAISLGITGFGIAEHNKHKPELETQLKKILDPATEQMQRNLIQDSKNGVLGAVNHMSNQIKQAMQATAPEIHVFPYQRPSQQHHLYELPIGDPLYEDPW